MLSIRLPCMHEYWLLSCADDVLPNGPPMHGRPHVYDGGAAIAENGAQVWSPLRSGLSPRRGSPPAGETLASNPKCHLPAGARAPFPVIYGAPRNRGPQALLAARDGGENPMENPKAARHWAPHLNMAPARVGHRRQHHIGSGGHDARHEYPGRGQAQGGELESQSGGAGHAHAGHKVAAGRSGDSARAQRCGSPPRQVCSALSRCCSVLDACRPSTPQFPFITHAGSRRTGPRAPLAQLFSSITYLPRTLFWWRGLQSRSLGWCMFGPLNPFCNPLSCTPPAGGEGGLP